MNDAEVSMVLLICSEDVRGGFLASQLEADGFAVAQAAGAAEGARALERVFPDVVVVDAQLDDGSGLVVVDAVRGAQAASSRVDPATPVVVVTHGASPLERVRALDRGADDALAGPGDYFELLARVRALLRRTQSQRRRGLLRVGPLRVDPVSRHVQLGEQEIELSHKEFQLLEVLASEPTRVFRKEELLRGIWGYPNGVSRTRTLDSHACRLRQKLRVDGARFIVNVWGVGYRLVDGPIEVVAPPALLEHALPNGLAVAA